MSDTKTLLELELEAEIAALKDQRLRERETFERRRVTLDEQIKDKERALRAEWNRKANEEIQALQTKLREEYKINKTDAVAIARFGKIWAIAWDRGHSSGLGDVENCFHEMAELL
jgi:hypothetical protein